MDSRTHHLLHGPIAPTLVRLAIPSTLVIVAQLLAGLAETWFVSRLGTEALAAMALVFPVLMLCPMMSSGAMGGGISSSVARALGAGDLRQAHALFFHAIEIALALGACFTLVVVGGGAWLYPWMGVGSSLVTEMAIGYSDWLFSGAVLVWVFNALVSVVRGCGNMWVPARVILVGTALLLLFSPLLILGWGDWRGIGMLGGAWALLLYYALGSLALIVYLLSPSSLLRPRWADAVFQRALFMRILGVGLAAMASAACTNLAIATATSLMGPLGPEVVAGYGTAARLEYIMVSLVFGLGSPLVAMVGTCVGAGDRQRALRVTWIGAALAVGITETVGLLAAAFPQAWVMLFNTDAAVVQAGTVYLRWVEPWYGFFGLGLVLYFASQGAAKMFWPVMGNLLRLVIAAGGGWSAWTWGWGMDGVFATQALGLVAYGLLVAWAVRGGAWFR
ncbi:MAG: MATE family efflux transporter [Alphaproteobacteria bacterium]|nr:MATE family efflux transporter [Alphaproteobacteria bacterium]